MPSPREQAEEAVIKVLITPMRYDDWKGAANAASDVWEPLARALRDHSPNDWGFCWACRNKWPCAVWLQTSDVLGE